MESIFTAARKPAFDQIRTIRGGVSAEAVVEVSARLGVEPQVLGKKLRLKATGFNDRHKLTAGDTEKILRVARVWNRTHALLRRQPAAVWFFNPTADLGNLAPIDVLFSDVGAAHLEAPLIGRVHDSVA